MNIDDKENESERLRINAETLFAGAGGLCEGFEENSPTYKMLKELIDKRVDEQLEKKIGDIKLNTKTTEEYEDAISVSNTDTKIKSSTDKDYEKFKGFFFFFDDENPSLENATVETKLSEYIKARGITQVWLAEKIGVDKTTIINIIKKPKSISLLNAYKISMVIGEKIEVLFPFILEGEKIQK